MHISNYRLVKRVGDVIAIFARVAAELDARLILVGAGPEATVAEIDRMADYAIDLFSDCPRRRAFAAVARSHAAMNFDYHKIVPQYEAIYERVLEAP